MSYDEHLISMAGGDGDETVRHVFDYDAPLPDLHIPVTQSWEPAAKHYRDLEPVAAITATEAGETFADRMARKSIEAKKAKHEVRP